MKKLVILLVLTHLFISCTSNSGENLIEELKYLIEKAWISQNENKSALIEAVLAHKKNVVEYLLSKGAAPNFNIVVNKNWTEVEE